MNQLKILSVSLLLVTANIAYAEEKTPDILQIFDQFASSNAAASKCTKPSKETLTKYQANYLMVSLFTSQKLAEKYPKYTKEQISKAMKRKSDFISDKVFKIVKEKGCNDPSIQQLTKRFNLQAKWKLGK